MMSASTSRAMENANNAPITISAVVSRSARRETSRTGLSVRQEMT